MGKEFIRKMEYLERKYFLEITELEKGEEVSFKCFKDLSDFMAVYLTSKYCHKLIQEKPSLSLRDLEIWNRRVKRIEPIYRAFEEAIRKLYYETEEKRLTLLAKLGLRKYNQIMIDRESKIYQEILKTMEEQNLPNNVFPLQETYVIDLSKMRVVKVQ